VDSIVRINSRACWRLTETSARPSDVRIATAVSHLIGLFFSCALFLQISRTLAELHWNCRRRHHDHAASCSSAAQELSLRALDLPAKTCLACLPGAEPGARVPTCSSQLSTCVVAVCGCQNARRPTVWLILPCGLHTRSCALRLKRNLRAPCYSAYFPEAWGARQRAGCQS